MSTDERMKLADKIAAFPVSADWTAQLHPPEERSQYDFVVVKLSEADRDAVVAALTAPVAGADAGMRAALEFIRDGYERGDINHVDFRVGAYKAALQALSPDATRS